MRGTQRVGSLVRLLLCAGFLCVAWVVLSSSQAQAAERVDPIDQLLTAVTDATSTRQADRASVPTKTPSHGTAAHAAKDSTAPSGKPDVAKTGATKTGATKAGVAKPQAVVRASGAEPPRSVSSARYPLQPNAVRDLVDAVVDLPEATLAPLVGEVRTTTASTVAAGAEVLKGTAHVVPALEQPVAGLTDGLVALVEVVPVVGGGGGVDPVVDGPLPLLPGDDAHPGVEPARGLEALAYRITNPLAAQGNTSPLDRLEHPLAVRWTVPNVDDGPAAPLVADERVSRGVTPQPDPADMPGPSPSPLSSPMPVGSSVPNPGSGSAAGDLAALDPASLLPRPTTGAYSSCDWRVPGGQPADPGSRPD